VQADNDDDGGRVLALADAIRKEFGLVTAAQLNLFVDRDALEWR
jgi:hypothetical protein